MANKNDNATTDGAAANLAVDDLSKIQNKQLLDDIRQAETALAARMEALRRRKIAPNTGTAPDTVSPFEETARIACPDAYWQGRASKENPRGSIPPKWHTFYGLAEKAPVYVSKGYLPVLMNGMQVKVEGMPLYKIPQELYESEIRSQGAESSERLKAAVKVGDANDTDPKARALTDEQIEVTKP